MPQHEKKNAWRTRPPNRPPKDPTPRTRLLPLQGWNAILIGHLVGRQENSENARLFRRRKPLASNDSDKKNQQIYILKWL